MIPIELIIISGVIIAIPCAVVGWRFRGQNVPVSANMFIMMAGGSLAIALFYGGVRIDAGGLVEASRWLWMFILLSTAIMAISVLILKRDKWHGRR